LIILIVQVIVLNLWIKQIEWIRFGVIFNLTPW